MGGLRPVTPDRIGNWRRHKPRLLAQIELHGSIQEDLERLGYESDGGWTQELEGVIPENGESHWPETAVPRPFRSRLRRGLRILRYAAGVWAPRP